MKVTNAKTKYTEEAVKALQEKFGFKSVMAVPCLKKIIINVGTGRIAKETEKVEEIKEAITQITGQKPLQTKARKAISGFKLREGMEVGIKVTLRGQRMWDFVDRLVNATLPRTRDFQGIDLKAVDGSGNLNIGIREQLIFPEISPEKVRHIFGLQVTVVSSARNKEEGIELYRLLGFPLKKD